MSQLNNKPTKTMPRITIILNKSILTNDDLAVMAYEAIEAEEMIGGLWAIEINQYAMFDHTNMSRNFREYHNAIVCVDLEPPPSTRAWVPKEHSSVQYNPITGGCFITDPTP